MDYFSKFKLDGKKAVVTGGAGGIGAACVDALLQAGAEVIVVDFSAENLAAAKERLEGKPVSFEKLDITDPKAVRALADKLPPVDILVNNAGIGRQTAGEDITEGEWNEVMAVNMNGVFWCAQAFGRHMIERGTGSIVNVGSMAGEIVVRPQKNVHYNASKAGVHHITKSLAAEWAPRGVRVNAVAPGFIETPMNGFALKNDVATTNIWLGNTPSGKVGQTHEIASIVLFLASEASSLMTGSIVIADGGYCVW
ncbi:SDR family NAD(P)-dependent oxidoreductase [Rhizobium rhizogenes]|uniref:3-oxoacyl-ACP reductase n=1 Tax=Rhizobium rhizogenes TaxID=359 RepID=A0AA92BZV2_RHIRH|nr:SDR family oxidoreductase [Rhizobium rhizogenes]PVE50607.1 3-oxoacyl-ACP reductase [Rhizobium rhizogenes]PVE62392.1 3-oxoacyl-ACP reductase [Agrobacterium tumefaciens]PVE70575.1 3-oxoacyl-ACP reductase [Sphingomonas sp. TPD3009]